MFRNHNPIIGAHARASASGLGDVLRFVCATIQQSIEEAPAIYREFRDKGAESPRAFGWKGDALAYYEEHAQEIFDGARARFEGAENPAHELTAYFAELPGLGLAKGGFVAQLAFGVSGCLDSHNLKRFDIAPGKFTASAFKALRKADSRAARVSLYLDTVKRAGGCEGLWDSWCDYVAELRPERFETGFEVSALHVEALELTGRGIPF